MKHLIFAAAAALLILPASAETLKTGPVIKEMKKVCVAGLKAEGFKQAGAYCNCFTGKLKSWANAETGVEQQMRLWTIKSDLLPEGTTDEEFFRRAGEAGISKADMETAMILNYYALEDIMASCAEPYE